MDIPDSADAAAEVAAPLPAEEVFRRVADAVVAVEVPDGAGAGVLLSTSGLIATSQHMVEGWSTARVRFRDAGQARVRVVRAYRDADLAFLQLEEAMARQASARVRSPLITDRAPAGRVPEVGETIYAIGHPLGLPYTLTQGIVSAVGREIGGRRYLQVDAAINPGNSGGPLYDTRARLVGLNACSRAEAQGLNFAVPADEVFQRFNAYLRERDQGAVHYCISCGATSREAVYCDHCGALLALADGVAELEAAASGEGSASGEGGAAEPKGAAAEPKGVAAENGEAAEDGATPRQPPLPVCPACGEANIPGAAYCSRCGTDL
jgi:serine protease Do